MVVPHSSLRAPAFECLTLSAGVLIWALAGCGTSETGSKGSAGSAALPAGGGASAGAATGSSSGAATGGAAGSATGGTSVGVGGTNGSSGAAGSGAAAGAAGAGQAGATASCSPDYLLCEDFEAASVGSVPTGWTKHGNAAVAEDQANHGKHSLKISPADNGERRIYHPTTMLGAAHWGRVYYLVQLPTPDAFVHSTMVTFYGTGPDIGAAEFRVVDTVKDAKTGGFAGGKHQFIYNVQPSGSEFGAGSDYNYTFDDKWHCAEWHVDATAQSVEFYYDNVQVDLKAGDGYPGAKLPTTFSEVRVGWNNYQSAPPGFTAWLDDFAVDDQRIGCLQ